MDISYKICLKSYNYLFISDFYFRVLRIFDYYLSSPSSLVSTKKKIKKVTVLRSPHIDKKSREQFEMRSYSSFFSFSLKKSKTDTFFTDQISNSVYAGLGLSIKKTYKISL